MEKIVYRKGVIVEEDKTKSENIEIDESRTGNISFEKSVFRFGDEKIYIDKRDGGSLRGKAIYLSDYFDWVLCNDAGGALCLVPLKKEDK